MRLFYRLFCATAAACCASGAVADSDLDRYIEQERLKSERIIEDLSQQNREHTRAVREQADRNIDAADPGRGSLRY